ncbi:MAG: hypothetical protein LBU05_03100 [Bifidobacteriaceae bacterium]|nr:hypothetical protein [Bifidobacteriaceae bacterium]
MTGSELLAHVRRNRWLTALALAVGFAVGLVVPTFDGDWAGNATVRAALAARRTSGTAADVRTPLQDAVGLGLSEADYEALSAAAELAEPPRNLANAISLGRVPDSSVVEVSVALPDHRQAAVVAAGVIDIVVCNAQELAKTGVTVKVVSLNATDTGEVSNRTRWSRRATLGVILGAASATLALTAAYFRRRTILGPGTLQVVSNLPVLADFEHPSSRATPGTPLDVDLVLEKMKLRAKRPIRFLTLCCATPQEALLATGAVSINQLAARLGERTLVVAAHGQAEPASLSNWGELSAVSSNQEQIIVSTALQRDGVGAGKLADLAKSRPVVFVTDTTPLGLACAASADATLIAAFTGVTATKRLASEMAHLDQVDAKPVGALLLSA